MYLFHQSYSQIFFRKSIYFINCVAVSKQVYFDISPTDTGFEYSATR